MQVSEGGGGCAHTLGARNAHAKIWRGAAKQHVAHSTLCTRTSGSHRNSRLGFWGRGESSADAMYVVHNM